jgi:hypothetical protein
VAALATTDAQHHHRVYRAVAALDPVAVGRLGPTANPASEQVPLDLAVLDELLGAGELGHSALLAEIVLVDRVERLGRDHPQTLAAAGLFLDAHRRLDDRELGELLLRNERLVDALSAALGPDHPTTRSAEVKLSRLRSLWAQRRQFAAPGQ